MNNVFSIPNIAPRPRRQFVVVVQGLFERSDSIGYDAVFQYKALCELYPDDEIDLFAETFVQSRYPDVNIQDVKKFFTDRDDLRDATLIYHYCDGWADCESYLPQHRGPIFIRWHNNTPPWFYAAVSPGSVARTLSGFERIVTLLEDRRAHFMVNSRFTARQLEVLGGAETSTSVVFPASRYLSSGHATPSNRPFGDGGEIRLLFVSRVVAHKGHKHIVALADYIQRTVKMKVVVDFAGRDDGSAPEFNVFLRDLGPDCGVSVTFHGEISEKDLLALYRRADVLVCFSEHEGFGLPVFEAMRCGLPVVAWARTGLAELLVDHPLSQPNLDLRWFAAAILQLSDEPFRQSVIAAQYEMLSRYTREAVLGQLQAALEPQKTQPGEAPPSTAPTTQSAAAKAQIDLAKASLMEAEPGPPHYMAQDAGENFVTLYDLQSYRHLLESGGSPSRIALDRNLPVAPVDHIDLRPMSFSTVGGRHLKDGIAFDGKEVMGSHVVYGPYVRCPPGRYAAEFCIAAEPPTDGLSTIRADVSTQPRGTLAAGEYTLGDAGDADNNFRLQFFVAQEVDNLEFRLEVVSSEKRQILFKGVRVSRAQDLGTLAEAAEVRPNAGDTTERIMRLLRKVSAETTVASPESKSA